MHSKRILNGLTLMFLVLFMTACAAKGTAPSEGAVCLHPSIDPSTNGGISAAVQKYQEALDRCNALNATYEATHEATYNLKGD